MKQILQELLNQAQIPYTEIQEELLDDGITRYNIMSEEPQIVVGRHGETLFAIQHVFRLMTRRMSEDGLRMIVDANDYRKKQEQNVISLSETKIAKLREHGGVIHFNPMPSYKRRAIHMHIMENHTDIDTKSVGVGQDRKLTISLKDNTVEETA